MKYVLLSDTHLQHNFTVPDGDALLHAGDFTWVGNIQEMTKAATWFGKLPHKHKIAICGNHDWLGEKNPTLTKQIFNDNGVTYLHDASTELGGLKIWGSPYQPEFGNWAFNLSRYDMSLRDKWAQIPEDTDILITHGPPRGLGDMTTGAYHPPEHAGCYDLNQRVQALPKLKLHVFGHIHSGAGKYDRENKIYVNASVCNEAYKPVNSPIVVDL